HVDENNTRYTGEGVARLARTFSECGIIVVLNQYLEAQFDLGLRGHLESFADLNIDADLIAKPGLWTQVVDGHFRPWHWPVLADAVGSFKRRVNWLLEGQNFQSSVTQTLGMTSDNAGKLSDTAFGFLAPGATSFEGLEKVSFAEFVGSNSAAVDTRDGNSLVQLDRAAAARLASSRIRKWVDREVLGPQDVLVDIPHLLQRAPYLMAGPTELDSWNDAAGGNKELVSHVPQVAWFAATDWIVRPALWWSVVEADEGVSKVRATFDYSMAPDFVFAEDCSTFIPIAAAKEFRAGFHNQYDRRYLKLFKGIRYSPQRRFAFGS
ncbi:hypothetical protein, partial [Thiobacillus sp.]|uniref:hypothetical protein n=1 Tax=Thiobacillus sp. TaxID=924 RepID=UPI0025D7BC7B